MHAYALFQAELALDAAYDVVFEPRSARPGFVRRLTSGLASAFARFRAKVMGEVASSESFIPRLQSYPYR